jgi:hypothetical protein
VADLVAGGHNGDGLRDLERSLFQGNVTVKIENALGLHVARKRTEKDRGANKKHANETCRTQGKRSTTV